MSEYFNLDTLKAYIVFFFCLVLPLGAVVYYHEQSKITLTEDKQISVPSKCSIGVKNSWRTQGEEIHVFSLPIRES